MPDWDLDADLLSLLPPWYAQVQDYQQLCLVEGGQFAALAGKIKNVDDNFYFQTMGESAIAEWEKIFDIIANPALENLEFRRNRLLNRFSLRPPFTMAFLYQKLDELIGAGQWNIEMDYANYTLYIESAAENQQYAIEVAYTLDKLKPAHIVYINRPFIANSLQLAEEISLGRRFYNYNLGSWGLGVLPFARDESDAGYKYRLGAWGLGVLPFAEPQALEVIKMAGTPSLTMALLNDVADFIGDDVAAALINGSIRITELTKELNGNILTVSYQVESADTAAITSVVLLNSAGQTLSRANVFVPVVGKVVLKHSIKVNEGGQINGG